MEICISDPALFYKVDNQKRIGVCTTYVDDTLDARNVDYADIGKESELKFKCKDRV